MHVTNFGSVATHLILVNQLRAALQSRKSLVTVTFLYVTVQVCPREACDLPACNHVYVLRNRPDCVMSSNMKRRNKTGCLEPD